MYLFRIYLNISLWKCHNLNYAKSLACSKYFDHSQRRTNHDATYENRNNIFCCYNFSEELHLGVSFCSHRNIAILFAIPLTFPYIPACLTHAFPLTKFEDFECLWYFLPWDHIDTKCSSSVVEDKKQSGSWYLGSSYLAAAEKFSCSIHSHSVTYDVNYIWHLIKIKINIDPCYLCMIVFCKTILASMPIPILKLFT